MLWKTPYKNLQFTRSGRISYNLILMHSVKERYSEKQKTSERQSVCRHVPLRLLLLLLLNVLLHQQVQQIIQTQMPFIEHCDCAFWCAYQSLVFVFLISFYIVNNMLYTVYTVIVVRCRQHVNRVELLFGDEQRPASAFRLPMPETTLLRWMIDGHHDGASSSGLCCAGQLNGWPTWATLSGATSAGGATHTNSGCYTIRFIGNSPGAACHTSVLAQTMHAISLLGIV